MFHEIIYKELPNTHYIRKYLYVLEKYSKINTEYMENHHILPVANFPKYSNCDWNIISISPRLHTIVHYILAKEFGGKYWFSVNIMMSCENPYQQRKLFNKLSPRLYECAITEYRKQQSIEMKILRKSESDEKKQKRILKWRESRNALSEKEYNSSFEKASITKKMNLELGLTIPKTFLKILCTKCNKMISETQYSRHINSSNCGKKLPIISTYCEFCGIIKYKNHKCLVIIGNERRGKIYSCTKCCKVYKREMCYKTHILLCNGHIPKKRT